MPSSRVDVLNGHDRAAMMNRTIVESEPRAGSGNVEADMCTSAISPDPSCAPTGDDNRRVGSAHAAHCDQKGVGPQNVPIHTFPDADQFAAFEQGRQGTTSHAEAAELVAGTRHRGDYAAKRRGAGEQWAWRPPSTRTEPRGKPCPEPIRPRPPCNFVVLDMLRALRATKFGGGRVCEAIHAA